MKRKGDISISINYLYHKIDNYVILYVLYVLYVYVIM